ncbi:MAG: GNAT family N-acetyltransferase [Ruminococcus sp.]|nr:GNAT family N-acetyltransferase [Ruminococcus sp.]
MRNIDSERAAYARRFGWCRDSMVKSWLDGFMGTGYASDEGGWAFIRSGDFFYLAGRPDRPEDVARYIREEMGSEAVIVPEDMSWKQVLTSCGLPVNRVTRFHTRLPEAGLDRALLEQASKLTGCECVRLVRAGEREYEDLAACGWENSFVSNFSGREDFLKNGFAYCVYVGVELASAASTFGYYSGGYELQIATDPKFRRRGYACAAAAAFLLECLDRGKRPHWDAANMTSVRIAQRLGFEYDGEYEAMEIGR